jgi:hypothetical protein
MAMLEARSTRDNYSREELLRAAYMAGKGETACVIAKALRTTPRGVYSLCQRHGIALIDKREEEEVIQIRILSKHFDAVGIIAARKGVDPLRLLSEIFAAVFSDSLLTARIAEKIDENETKARSKRARSA